MNDIENGLLECLKRIRGTINVINGTTENSQFPGNKIDGVSIRKLFISNLAKKTTHKDLFVLFSKYGDIINCYLKRNQRKSNYAFVTFSNVHDAIRALTNGSTKQIRIHNRDLKVIPANSWHQPDNIENQKYYKTNSTEMNKTSHLMESDVVCIADGTQILINDLNDDCLLNIFFYLPILDKIRIERVCKRWNVVVRDFWHTVKNLNMPYQSWGFKNKLEFPNTAILRQVLLRCGKSLTEISFSINFSLASLDENTLNTVGKLCPNLKIADITRLHIFPSGLDVLASNCHKITKLSLGYSKYICDGELIKLFQVNKNLKYLSINATKISGRCLFSLPSNTMEELFLLNCHDINKVHLSNALVYLSNLKSLSIYRIYIDIELIQPIGKCTKLIKLYLCGHYQLDPENEPPNVPSPIELFHLTELKNLEILKLDLKNAVRDDLLIAIATNCTKLTQLDINECLNITDDSISVIANLPKLENLCINRLLLVTGRGLGRMYNLKRLECRDCCCISDLNVCLLLSVAPNLELLDLVGCISITDCTRNTAMLATRLRTNNLPLKMYINETLIDNDKILNRDYPLLHIIDLYYSKKIFECI